MAVTLHPDIVFDTVPGYRPLALDLYLGDGLGDAPEAVCVYLHGGGWRRGSRRDGPGHMNGPGRHFFHHMAGRGLAVAACDYRLSGEARYPAQLDDVVAACRFVQDGLGEAGLSGLPLTMWGLSAGAHLAALTALSSPVADSIGAVTCWSAPSDLAAQQDDVEAVGGEVDRGPTSREALLLGGLVDELPELAREASPVHHARAASTRFQLVHGTADVNVPIAQSERFAAALDAAGSTVDLVRVGGADHFYTTIDRDRLARLVDDSVDFLLGAARATASMAEGAVP